MKIIFELFLFEKENLRKVIIDDLLHKRLNHGDISHIYCFDLFDFVDLI